MIRVRRSNLLDKPLQNSTYSKLELFALTSTPYFKPN